MFNRGIFFIFSVFLLTACQPEGASSLNFRAPDSVPDDLEFGERNSKPKLGYNVELQVADRAYVESVLLQVFNAAGTPAATYIQSDIYQKVEFGGACDFYAPSDISTTTVEFPRENCSNGISDVQPANNNPMRYSLTTKVCEKLVIDSARMGVIRSKLFSNNKWAKPDDVSIAKAWALFFTIDQVNPLVVTELKAIAAATGSDEEAWKYIVLTLCISPEWQTL